MNIAFVSYETPFAPCGGIAAVLGRLPQRVHAASHVNTAVVTPFHHRVGRMAALACSREGTFGVPFEGRSVLIHVHRYDDKVPYYLLLPEDRAFFSGQRHPYDVSAERLLRDALLFGAAVPRALHVVAPGARWTLLLQDWEAATVALAAAEEAARSRMFVTLHNSYDCPVDDRQLDQAGINPGCCPGGTVLDRALQLTELPIFTVSEQFARDLTQETLQTRVLAPHLQGILRSRLVGVDNGPFVDLAVEPALLDEVRRGRCEPLLSWKRDRRQEFLAAIDQFEPGPERPVWGDPRAFARDEAPWFVMAGRDDGRQKGYDLAARAAENFLSRRRDGRFIFFPIPGDEGRRGLGFLESLARRFPREVLVFPFQFREGFLGALRGASFGVIPSLYEPFGMANEFYLNGTVGLGRATGGIVQQIVPLRGLPSFTRAVDDRASRVHASGALPTGLLFREPDGLATEAEDWAAINAAAYGFDGQGPNRLEARLRLPLFEAMAEQLVLALEDAAAVFQNKPAYCGLIAAGIEHIERTFSWERAARDYMRHVVA
jgi:glycogen synthase